MARKPGKYAPDSDAEPIGAEAAEEFVHKLIKKVEYDFQWRQPWARRQAHFLRRRYAKEFRDVDFPFPNAADIVIPVIDMAIDRLKPLVLQSTIGAHPAVTMEGSDVESQKKEPLCESVMDHLMESRIPMAKEEIAYAADFWAQMGYTIFKAWYDYRTRPVREFVERDRLPVQFQSILAPADFSPEDADAIFRATGRAVLTKEELKAGDSPLRIMLRQHFNLDPEDKLDKQSEEKLIKWLVNGSGEGIWIKRREVYRDTPRFAAIPNENIVFPAYTEDIQDARRIAHVFYLTEDEIKERARDNRWDANAIVEMMDSRKTNQRRPGAGNRGLRIRDTELARARDLVFSQYERVARYTYDDNDLFELWEIYFYMDLDGDDVLEKVSCIVDPLSGECLKPPAEIPFAHGQWPFVAIKREHADRILTHTRGVGEILDDLDVEITAQRRASLNQQTMTTAPMFTYRINAQINPNTIKFIPGQGIPVQRPGEDIVPLVFPNHQFDFERMEQSLSGWVERRIGTQDLSSSEQGRLTRPRTATEINFLGAIEAKVLGPSLVLWHSGMSRLYEQIWALWLQYGPDEVDIRITGDDAIVDVKRVSRHDIQGKFKFKPTPSALNNPATRVQDAQALFQLTLQAAQLGPEISDNIRLDLAEALIMLYDAVDARRGRRVARRLTDQEKEQMAKQRAEQQNPQVSLSGPLNQVQQQVGGIQQAARQGRVGSNVRITG